MELNFTDYFYAFMALLFVIALISLMGMLARRMGFGFPTTAKNAANRRLSVIEAINLDAKHRLVLIKRDDIEHLILLGGESELLIENHITPPGANITALPDIISNGQRALKGNGR